MGSLKVGGPKFHMGCNPEGSSVFLESALSDQVEKGNPATVGRRSDSRGPTREFFAVIVRHETGRHHRHAIRCAALMVLLVLSAGCSMNGDQSTFEELGQDANTRDFGRRFPQDPNSAFTFGPGDTLIVTVADTPEFSGPHIIRSDGKITVPLVNDVTAAGLTTNQLAKKLESLVAIYVKDPKVTVSVGAVVSKSFFIAAQDPSRGGLQMRKVPYAGDIVLLDVMASLPMTALHDTQHVKVIRGDPRNPVVYTINAERIIFHGETGGNLQIRPDDIILVPPTFLGHLSMWINAISMPFQGLFRVTTTAMMLDSQVRFLSGDTRFARGQFGGGFWGGGGGFNNNQGGGAFGGF